VCIGVGIDVGRFLLLSLLISHSTVLRIATGRRQSPKTHNNCNGHTSEFNVACLNDSFGLAVFEYNNVLCAVHMH